MGLAFNEEKLAEQLAEQLKLKLEPLVEKLKEDVVADVKALLDGYRVDAKAVVTFRPKSDPMPVAPPQTETQ